MRASRRTGFVLVGRMLVLPVLLGVALAGCNAGEEIGYVEIKTVPASAQRPPSLYLDNNKLAPVQKGVALLKQRTGTTKLAVDGVGGQPAVLCDIEVKKNRITTVTVSVLERPPRCQCRNASASRVCVS